MENLLSMEAIICLNIGMFIAALLLSEFIMNLSFSSLN